MPCTISEEQIERTIAFHGHYCPGLSIGIRAAELAIRELGRPSDIEMVAVSETDMCGVDAIQVLTGCTYGKGNFVHRDLGKMAFSFFDRKTEKGFRAVLNSSIRNEMDREMGDLMTKAKDGTATDAHHKRLEDLRELLKKRYMDIDLEEMFVITPLQYSLPRPARVLASMTCDICKEKVMESRTRRFDGQTMCIPCFDGVEQKI